MWKSISFAIVDFNSALEEIISNLVRVSIDSEGNVYNSIGYKDGYYASSASVLGDKADASCTVTGLMPNPLTSINDSIYVKGATLDTSQSHCRAVFATDVSTIKGAIYSSNWTKYFAIETLDDTNYYKLTPLEAFATTGYTACEYFRLSLIGTGENLVVSAEPIE